MKRLALALAVMALLLTGMQPARAIVSAISAAPAQINVSYGMGASTFTITWIVNRTLVGGPVTLFSPAGRFDVNGVVGTTTSITRVFPGNPKTMTVVETVTVPQFVMRKAIESNNGQIFYTRDFADDPAHTFLTRAVQVDVTGGMGGPLGLSDVTLSFDNNTTFDTLHRNDPLRAVAHIRSTGAGQLTGVWEISDNGADTTAFFRPIRTVTTTLTGQRIIDVISPPLPTSSDGRFDVRFRVTSPPRSGIAPLISYYVTGPGKNAPQGSLDTSQPAADATVANGTGFKWAAIKHAAAYRLQILDTSGNPVASMLVRGTETTLSAFVLSQLQGPATYKWRVTALDAEGDIVGSSTPKSIRVKGK